MDRFFDDLNQLLQPTQDYGTQYANRLALNAMFTVIADLLGLGPEDEDTPLGSQERWYRKDDWQIMGWAEFFHIISSDAPGLRREAFLKECVGNPNDPNPDYANTIKRHLMDSVKELTTMGEMGVAENPAFVKSWRLCENFIDNIWNLRNADRELVVIEYDQDGYPAGAQFPNARAFPSQDAEEFYTRFFQAYYAHVVESYNHFGAEVKQLHNDASSSLPSQQVSVGAASRLLEVFNEVFEDEEAFIDDWFGTFIHICSDVYEHDVDLLMKMMLGQEPMGRGRGMSAQKRGMFMAMNCSVSPRTSAALFKHIRAGREWSPMLGLPAAAAAAAAFPSDKIKIAKTTKEYMSVCLTTGKTADECMHNTCPVCQETFIKNGRLVRPVMFHKSHDSENKEMWVDPIHPEEQAKWGRQCMGCRKQLGITPEQLNAIASELRATSNAILLQRMMRGHRTRKSSIGRTVANRLKREREYFESREKFHDLYLKQQRQQAINQNRAAFNAAFPPSKLRSRSRARSNSMTRSKTRSKSRSKTRSKRHSANF
jgi:hypothetical protein